MLTGDRRASSVAGGESRRQETRETEMHSIVMREAGMHSIVTPELVRQHLEEVYRKAEDQSRHRPARRRHDLRVLRRFRHVGE